MRARSVNRPRCRWWLGLAVLGWLLGPRPGFAQAPASGPLTLVDAVQLALKNYPALKESRARAQAADEGIGVARTAYLPRLDMLWQENQLDVRNPDLRLGAGMYGEVQWPVRRPQPSLLVPPTSIVTTTERTFVIRVSDGVAEWVNVACGARVGDLVEVFGALKDGDTVVRRGTDEIREGAKVNVAQPTAS